MSRFAGRVTLVIVNVLALAGVAGAAPDSPAVSEDAWARGGVRVGVGLGLGWRFGDRCVRESDVVSCTSGPLAGSLQLDGRYRFGAFSAGALLAGGRALGAEAVPADELGPLESVDRWLWRASAEGRWHPALSRSVDAWVGAEIGVAGEVLVRDVRDGGDETTGDVVLAGGLGLGGDLALTRAVAMTMSARLLYADLRTSAPALEPQSPLWLGMTLGVTFGL